MAEFKVVPITHEFVEAYLRDNAALIAKTSADCWAKRVSTGEQMAKPTRKQIYRSGFYDGIRNLLHDMAYSGEGFVTCMPFDQIPDTDDGD